MPKRSFPAATILYAIAGSLSVTYPANGCESQRTYQEIITNHASMLSKN
jgi:hypothetical protein